MPHLTALPHRQQPFTAPCPSCGGDATWVATLRDQGTPALPPGNWHAGDSTWLRIECTCNEETP